MDGILYLAMGTEYDFLAAHTAAKTREHTQLPIAVVSDRAMRHKKWDDVSNVRFINVDIPCEWNRAIKTLACNYTPFDRTIFMDADAFVQRPGVEVIFDALSGSDFAFHLYRKWDTNNCIPNIMARALDTFELDVPIQEYHSACFCFTNGVRVQNFFIEWHQYWHRFGCGRDMPPLACLMKNKISCGMHIGQLTKSHFASNYLDPSAIVQHDPGTGFPASYGIPAWVPWHVPTDNPNEFKRVKRTVK